MNKENSMTQNNTGPHSEPANGSDGLQARTDALYIALEVCSAELFAQCADQPRAMKYLEQARHALALEQCARAAAGRPAQIQPQPSGNAGEFKTDVDGLLAAIRDYGSWKYAEAKGRTAPDLSDVRAAWDEVYEKVQTLAALAQQASTDNRTSSQTAPECLRDAFSVTAIEAAAKVITDAMGWSWAHMPQEGRDIMRKNARKAIDAARAAAKAQP